MNILITGGKGQLASCIRKISETTNDLSFVFTDVEELDITNLQRIEDFLQANTFDFIVNCAAYTAVDLAEEEVEKAEKINSEAAESLAIACKKHSIKLIHISTDFVFSGDQSKPYLETDATNPINIYGKTKLKGEECILSILEQYWVLRTSWLYSEYGNNFVKTMLRLGNEKEKLSIINDQIGSPTYAMDLAEVIVKIITENKDNFGIYHFSNEGVASWYDFAFMIMDYSKTKCKVLPIKATDYPAKANRPNFSVMDKTKIKRALNIDINHWMVSLKNCLNNLDKTAIK